MSRERAYRLRKRKNRVEKQKLVIAMFAVIFALLGMNRFGGVLSSAHGNLKEDPAAFKYYKSIEIESGDTLWGIAEEYMTSEYASVQEYIDEIKQINHLTSDNIHDSKHLMVAYYDSEFK